MSQLKSVAYQPTAKPTQLRRGLLVGAAVVALALATAFAFQQQAAATRTAAERANAAAAARWAGLAAQYAEAARSERVWAADAARWTGLAAQYGAATNRQVAEAARYTGLAVQAYVQTGDPALLPTCASSAVLDQLPAIGDDAWRAQIGECRP